ncbi:MAG: cytochrome c [Thiobacillus sp.]|nr:cytochrome c [Thiobacillus sp.]MDP2977791.1 cytochrome c [Thiobacillus sp.]
MKSPLAATLSLLAGLAIMAGSGQLLADPIASSAKPLALRSIMKDLGKNAQAITEGISHEDWPQVEKAALLIADHPQPPLSEKMRIMSFAGTRIGKFKSYDGETHDAARTVAKAAKAGEGEGVILAFQKLQTACHNCHREFRKPLIEHFYEGR